MKTIEHNGLALAYVGDSYYELKIREYLLENGLTKVNDLHKKAISYTSGESQAKFIDYMIENKLLFEDEINMYKRGRNANCNGKRKNISLQTYLKATGFEAMIGYLYLENKLDRITEILNIIYKIHKED